MCIALHLRVRVCLAPMLLYLFVFSANVLCVCLYFVGLVVEMAHEDMITVINQQLPPDIRLFGM